MFSRFFQIRKISDLTRICILPVMVLSIFLSFYLCVDMEKIQDKSQDLVKSAIPNVMATQQSAINLVQLKNEVELMVTAPDMARARQAYSDALMFINELHSSTNQELTRHSVDILFSLNHLWKLRLQLNDMRVSVNDSLHYMDTLLRLIAHEKPDLFPEVVLVNSNYIELFQSNTKLRNLLQDHINYAQMIRQRMHLKGKPIGDKHAAQDHTISEYVLAERTLAERTAPEVPKVSSWEEALAIAEATTDDGAEGSESSEVAESTENAEAEATASAAPESIGSRRPQELEDLEWIYDDDNIYSVKDEAQIEQDNEAAWTQAVAEMEKMAPDVDWHLLDHTHSDQRDAYAEEYASFIAAADAADAAGATADATGAAAASEEASQELSASADNAEPAGFISAEDQLKNKGLNESEIAHNRALLSIMNHGMTESALPEDDSLAAAAATVSSHEGVRARALVHLLALYESELKSFEPRWHIFMKLHHVFAYDAHNLLFSLDEISQSYTSGETDLLHKELSEISDLATETMPMVMVTIGFSLVGFWLVIFMLNRYIMVPLKNIARILIKFRHTKNISAQKYEAFASQEHLVEIREIVDVLPQLFADFSKMSEKSDVLEQRYDELLKHTKYDALTKILNRGSLNQLIKEVGTKTPAHFAVAMIDIDFFKNLNDTMGHQRGDEVLFAVAQTLQGNLSKKDLVFRYGGEEFCVILSEISAINAYKVASRLCKTISELKLINEGVPSNVVTVSIGLSLVTSSEAQFRVDELINQADKALYLAKRNGRNQVVACPRSMVVAMSESQSLHTSRKLAQRAADADAAADAADAAALAALMEQEGLNVIKNSADAEPAASPVDSDALAAKAAAADSAAISAALNTANTADTTKGDNWAKSGLPESLVEREKAKKALAAAALSKAEESLSSDPKVRAQVQQNLRVQAKSDELPAEPSLSSQAAAKIQEGKGSTVPASPDKGAEHDIIMNGTLRPIHSVERADYINADHEEYDPEERAPADCAISSQDVAILQAKDKLIAQLRIPPKSTFNREEADDLSQAQAVSGDNEPSFISSNSEEQGKGLSAQSYGAYAASDEHAEMHSGAEPQESAEISFTNTHYGEIGLRSGKVVDNLMASPITVVTSQGMTQEKFNDHEAVSEQDLKLYAHQTRARQWRREQEEHKEVEVVAEGDGGSSIYIPASHEHAAHAGGEQKSSASDSQDYPSERPVPKSALSAYQKALAAYEARTAHAKQLQERTHNQVAATEAAVAQVRAAKDLECAQAAHNDHYYLQEANAPTLVSFDFISEAATSRKQKRLWRKKQHEQEDAQKPDWDALAAAAAADHEQSVATNAFTQAHGQADNVDADVIADDSEGEDHGLSEDEVDNRLYEAIYGDHSSEIQTPSDQPDLNGSADGNGNGNNANDDASNLEAINREAEQKLRVVSTWGSDQAAEEHLSQEVASFSPEGRNSVSAEQLKIEADSDTKDSKAASANSAMSANSADSTDSAYSADSHPEQGVGPEKGAAPSKAHASGPLPMLMGGDPNAQPILDEELLNKMIAERSDYDEIDDVLGDAHSLMHGRDLSVPVSLFNIDHFIPDPQDHIRNNQGKIIGISSTMHDKMVARQKAKTNSPDSEPESWAHALSGFFMHEEKSKRNAISQSYLPKVSADDANDHDVVPDEVLEQERLLQQQQMQFQRQAEESISVVPLSFDDQQAVLLSAKHNGHNVQVQSQKPHSSAKERKGLAYMTIDQVVSGFYQRVQRGYFLVSGRSAELSIDTGESSHDANLRHLEQNRSSIQQSRQHFTFEYVQNVRGKKAEGRLADDLAHDLTQTYQGKGKDLPAAGVTIKAQGSKHAEAELKTKAVAEPKPAQSAEPAKPAATESEQQK